MYCTHLSTTFPNARKAYTCIWCGEKISAGYTHAKVVSVYDGFQSHRYHIECHSATSRYDWWESDGEFEPYSFSRGTCEER